MAWRSRSIATLLILTATLTATLTGLGTAQAQPQRIERGDEDLLVLRVLLGDEVLLDDLFAWLTPEGVLLPFDELTALLELAITTDLAAGRAEGFILSENRRFDLDLGRGEVVVDGRRTSFDDTVSSPLDPPKGTVVELHVDDIFVESRLLSRWLPIDFEVDIASLSLRLAPREVLPAQAKRQREARWRERRAMSAPGSGPRYDLRREPYGLFAWPMIDASFNVSLARRAEGTFGATASHSLLARGDLLGLVGGLFLGGSGDEARFENLDDARLVLGRRDPEGRLLGPLRATELRLGDVSPRFDPLISRGRGGRGFEIARSQGSRLDGPDPRAFDRTDLRGDALPGWDVELYRNNVLHDFLTVGTDGRWEFLDVPLDVGLNVLRAVLYGPQGQRREITDRVTIDAGLLPPGTLHYRFGAAQDDLGLLRGASAAGAMVGRDGRPGAWRLGGDLEFGLSRRFTLDAGVASLELDDGRQHYVTAGLRGSLFGVSTRLNVVADVAGGWATRLGLRRSLGRRGSLTVKHVGFSGFDSASTVEGLESSTEVRFSGQVKVPWFKGPLSRLPVSLTMTREQQAGGSSFQLNGVSGFSLPLGRLNIGHRLSFDVTSQDRRLGGTVLVNGQLWGSEVRGNLTYEVLPEPTLLDLSLTGERDVGERLRLRAELRQGLRQARTSISGGVDCRLRSAILGLRASLASDGNVEVGASLAFHLAPVRASSSRQRRLRMGAGAGASQAALLARVFLDRDANGHFSTGDEALPGVAFRAAGQQLEEPTDEKGVAYLLLPTDRHVDVELVEGSLEDPYWLPAHKGVGLLPRAGSVRALDFPVVETGEIDGTVRLRSADALVAVSNVELELVDAAGEVVARVKSQFDGFYLFERVRPGAYVLRLGGEQARRLGLAAAAREVELSGGEIRGGEDFVLDRPDTGT